MKVNHKKLKVGDKVLIWGKIIDVWRKTPQEGYNDVTLVFESGKNASLVSLELDYCEVEDYVDQDTVKELFEKISKEVVLNRKEKALLNDLFRVQIDES